MNAVPEVSNPMPLVSSNIGSAFTGAESARASAAPIIKPLAFMSPNPLF